MGDDDNERKKGDVMINADIVYFSSGSDLCVPVESLRSAELNRLDLYAH